MFSITGLIIACLIYHNAHGLPDTQIIGGNDAPEGKYLYQVSLKRQFSSIHICSGAIVSKRYVITAAHCLENLGAESDVVIGIGSNVLVSPDVKVYAAEKLISHPDYNKMSLQNDIGLIKLNEDISFDNKYANLINLTSDDRNFENVKFTVTGWDEIGAVPNRLQEITVTGSSQSMCADLYKNITVNHICTLEAVGKGICKHDSGSALTLDGKLVGIMSFGSTPCAGGYPDVFTKVYNYKAWIETYTINAQSTDAGNNQQSNIILGLIMTYLCVYSFL